MAKYELDENVILPDLSNFWGPDENIIVQFRNLYQDIKDDLTPVNIDMLSNALDSLTIRYNQALNSEYIWAFDAIPELDELDDLAELYLSEKPHSSYLNFKREERESYDYTDVHWFRKALIEAGDSLRRMSVEKRNELVWKYSFIQDAILAQQQFGLHETIWKRSEKNWTYLVYIEAKITGIKEHIYLHSELLQQETLFTHILEPFLSQTSFIFRGRQLNPKNIRHIQVFKTPLKPVEFGLWETKHNISSRTDYTLDFFRTCTECTDDLINHTTSKGYIEDDKWLMIDRDLMSKIKDFISIKQFSSAVQKAAIYLNELVKNRLSKDGLYDEFVVENEKKDKRRDGKNLFAAVFSPIKGSGAYTFNKSIRDEESSLQQGYQMLYQGMWMALRNPDTHAERDFTEQEAYEKLIIISHLIRMFDQATLVERKQIKS